jgi:hypothetical protein
VLFGVPPFAVATNESVVVLGNAPDSPGRVAGSLQDGNIRQCAGCLTINSDDRIGAHQFAFAVGRRSRSRAFEKFPDAGLAAELAIRVGEEAIIGKQVHDCLDVMRVVGLNVSTHEMANLLLSAHVWRPFPISPCFQQYIGGSHIYFLEPVSNSWHQVDDGAVAIAVGPDGQPWLVNKQGAVFPRTKGATSYVDGHWTAVAPSGTAGGTSTSIGVGGSQ